MTAVRCDQCGAELDEVMAQCAFCGARLIQVITLEEETRLLLETLEARIYSEIGDRTRAILMFYFLLMLLAGPASYFILGTLSDWGVIARLGILVLVAVVGVFVFAAAVDRREGNAEQAIWRDSISPSLARYRERKGLSETELIVMGQRMLGETTKLKKLLVPE